MYLGLVVTTATAFASSGGVVNVVAAFAHLLVLADQHKGAQTRLWRAQLQRVAGTCVARLSNDIREHELTHTHTSNSAAISTHLVCQQLGTMETHCTQHL